MKEGFYALLMPAWSPEFIIYYFDGVFVHCLDPDFEESDEDRPYLWGRCVWKGIKELKDYADRCGKEIHYLGR